MSVALGWPDAVRAVLHPRRAWARELVLDRSAIWAAAQKRARETKCDEKPMRELASARLASEAPPSELGPEAEEVAVAHVLADAPYLPLVTSWIITGLALAVDHWVVTGGVVRAAELVLALSGGTTDLAERAIWPAWRRLGWHLAAAPRDVAEAALAALRAAVPASAPQASVRAAVHYLAPETGEADRIILSTEGHARREVAFRRAVAAIDSSAALAHVAANCSFEDLMLSTVLDKSAGRLVTSTLASPLPTTMTLVARFEDEAIGPLLALMSRTRAPKKAGEALVEALGNLGTEAAFDVLAPAVRGKVELATLERFALRAPKAAHASITRALASPGKNAAGLRKVLAAIEARG